MAQALSLSRSLPFKAIQRRDELLQKSQADMDQARSALQEKSQEVEQLRARTQTLEANLQKVQQELGQSRDEEAAVHLEVQVLRQSVQESQERQQQAGERELRRVTGGATPVGAIATGSLLGPLAALAIVK